jgi:hypothetical protein
VAERSADWYAYPAAARHYQAAIGLTPLDDSEARAELLLGQATASQNADTPDQEILNAALHAQVRVERWEAAAEVEKMRAEWYQLHAAVGDEADAHLTRGAEYAARARPSTVMCRIATHRAYRLVASGHADKALTLTEEMLPLAAAAALEVGHAGLLQWQGIARVTLGDAEGVADMREGAATLARHAHGSTGVAYANLADTVRGLGDMAASNAAYVTAAEWARRFGQAPDLSATMTVGDAARAMS